MVDSEMELAYSGKLEVELRAATVVAVDAILRRIQEIGSEALKSQIQYAYQVDWLLWQIGEKSLNEMKPHHRVCSIFY